MAASFYNGEGPCSIVFDPGHFSLRVGFAGESLPKTEVPSFIGVKEDIKNENFVSQFINCLSTLHQTSKLILKMYFLFPKTRMI